MLGCCICNSTSSGMVEVAVTEQRHVIDPLVLSGGVAGQEDERAIPKALGRVVWLRSSQFVTREFHTVTIDIFEQPWRVRKLACYAIAVDGSIISVYRTAVVRSKAASP